MMCVHHSLFLRLVSDFGDVVMTRSNPGVSYKVYMLTLDLIPTYRLDSTTFTYARHLILKGSS